MEKERISPSPSVSSLRAMFDQNSQIQRELNKSKVPPPKPPRSKKQDSPKQDHLYAKVNKQPTVSSQARGRFTKDSRVESVYATVDPQTVSAQMQDRFSGIDPEDHIYATIDSPDEVINPLYVKVSQVQDRSTGNPGIETVYATVDPQTVSAQTQDRFSGIDPEDHIYETIDSIYTGASHARDRSTGNSKVETVYATIDPQTVSAQAQGRFSGIDPEDHIYETIDSIYTGASHARDRSTGNSKVETVYATIDPRRTGASQVRDRSTGDSGVETVYATANAPQNTDHLPRKGLLQRVEEDTIVQYSAAAVKHWAKAVYGDSGVLQNQMAKIAALPSLGSELSWEITESPTSVHRLAGINVFGIKNSTRKTAEASIAPLCRAIEHYVDAVKGAYEKIRHEQQKDVSRSEDRSSKMTAGIKQEQDLQQRKDHQRGLHADRVERPKMLAAAMM
ncbi:BID domain-containing T4SS effector [Bartonella sp. B10]